MAGLKERIKKKKGVGFSGRFHTLEPGHGHAHAFGQSALRMNDCSFSLFCVKSSHLYSGINK